MLRRIKESCERFADREAFNFNGESVSYRDLARKTTGYRKLLEREAADYRGLVGVLTNDSLGTYASILGTLFFGAGFVPLSPRNPEDRNRAIIEQAEIGVLINNVDGYRAERLTTRKGTTIIGPGIAPENETDLCVGRSQPDDIKCILFTSGSTGKPKGVPMSLGNINATIDAFFSLGYALDETDKFLQMFDFTFDMSLLSYIMPLCIGASVHHVPESSIKILAAMNIMKKHNITFAAMVPSTLAFLRKYLKDIRLESLRYSMLGGEPFYVDLAAEWAASTPNATIINISGPTETTMACMGYPLGKDPKRNKSYRGVLSFGRPWKNTTAIVVDDQLRPVGSGIQGELCFSGDNVMKGYWKDPDKNREVLFRLAMDGKDRIFYRSGDMAFVDEEGDFMSCGRTDHQFKVQGYKVELGEIEAVTREFIPTANVAAVAYRNSFDVYQIHLFIERFEGVDSPLMEHLRKKLPVYMIPSGITALESFPLNLNGKTDRKALEKLLLSRQ